MLTKTQHATHVLQFVDTMGQTEMDSAANIVIHIKATQFCPQTGRRTRWIQYTPFNFPSAVGIIMHVYMTQSQPFDVNKLLSFTSKTSNEADHAMMMMIEFSDNKYVHMFLCIVAFDKVVQN